MNDLAQPCRVPARDTQCYRLLLAMQTGERLTVAKALSKYGVYALSQRCGELKRMGWPVDSVMKTLGDGKRVAEYSLRPFLDAAGIDGCKASITVYREPAHT